MMKPLNDVNTAITDFNTVKAFDENTKKYASLVDSFIPSSWKLPLVATAATVTTLGVAGYALHKEIKQSKEGCNLKVKEIKALQKIVVEKLGEHAAKLFPHFQDGIQDKDHIVYPILYNKFEEHQFVTQGLYSIRKIQSMVQNYIGDRGGFKGFFKATKRNDMNCAIIEGIANYLAVYLPHWHTLAERKQVGLTREARKRYNLNDKTDVSPLEPLDGFISAIKSASNLGSHKDKLKVCDVIRKEIRNELFPYWQQEIDQQSFANQLNASSAILNETWHASLQMLAFLGQRMNNLNYEHHPNFFAIDIKNLSEGYLQKEIGTIQKSIPLVGPWQEMIMRVSKLCLEETSDYSLQSTFDAQDIDELFSNSHPIFRYHCIDSNQKEKATNVELEEISDSSLKTKRVNSFYALSLLVVETAQLQKILDNLATLSSFGGDQVLQKNFKEVLELIKDKTKKTIEAWEKFTDEKSGLFLEMKKAIEHSHYDAKSKFLLQNHSNAFDCYVNARICDGADTVGEQFLTYFKGIPQNLRRLNNFITYDMVWSSEALEKNQQKASQEAARLVTNLQNLSRLQITRQVYAGKSKKVKSNVVKQAIQKEENKITSIVEATTLPFLSQVARPALETEDAKKVRQQAIHQELENLKDFSNAWNSLHQLLTSQKYEMDYILHFLQHTNLLLSGNAEFLMNAKGELFLSIADFSPRTCRVNYSNSKAVIALMNDAIQPNSKPPQAIEFKTLLAEALPHVKKLNAAFYAASKISDDNHVHVSRNKAFFENRIKTLQGFIHSYFKSSNSTAPVEKLVSLINQNTPLVAKLDSTNPTAKVVFDTTPIMQKNKVEEFLIGINELIHDDNFAKHFKNQKLIAEKLLLNLKSAAYSLHTAFKAVETNNAFSKAQIKIKQDAQIIQKQREKISILEEAQISAKQQLHELEQTNKLLNEQVDSLKAQNLKLTKKIQELKGTSHKISQELNILKEEVLTSKKLTNSTIENLKTACDISATTFANILKAAETFQTQASEIEQNVHQVASNHESEQNSSVDVLDKSKVLDKIAEITELKARMKSSNQLLEHYKTLVQEIQKRAKEAHKMLLESLKKHEQNYDKLDAINSQIGIQFEKVNNAINAHNVIIQKLRQCNEEYKKIIEKLVSQVTKQLEQITVLKNENAESQKMINELKQEIELLKNSNSNDIKPISLSLSSSSMLIDDVTSLTSISHESASQTPISIQRKTAKRDKLAGIDKAFSVVAKHKVERCSFSNNLKFLCGIEVTLIVSYFLPQQCYGWMNMNGKSFSDFKEAILLLAIVGLTILVQKLPFKQCYSCLNDYLRSNKEKTIDVINKKEILTADDGSDGDGVRTTSDHISV